MSERNLKQLTYYGQQVVYCYEQLSVFITIKLCTEINVRLVL